MDHLRKFLDLDAGPLKPPFRPEFGGLLALSIAIVSFLTLCSLLPSLYHLYQWRRPQVPVPVLNLDKDRNYAAATDQYIHNFKSILEKGWLEFRHDVYQIWGVDGFVVIVPPEFVEELNAKGTAVVDLHTASQTRIVGDYEWLRIADHLLFHSVQNDVTRHIGELIPGLREEIDYACTTYLPSEMTELKPVPVWTCMLKIIALAVSRMTVGPELSRDEAWLAIMIGFLDDLFAGGWALKAWPRPLRPIAARGLVPGIRDVWKQQAKARKMLVPIIKQRREAESAARAAGKEWDRPNDLLQWLTDNAANAKPPKSDEFVAELCLVSGFGSLHASGTTLTNAVLDLAAMPEYQKILLEEYKASGTEDELFTDRGLKSLNALTKLDSFLKESQRMNPTTLTAFSRQVVKPVSLSNGLRLPKGTHILIPSAMVSWDPTVYPSPQEFDGLRYYKKRKEAVGITTNRNQFTSYSAQQLHFGFGRQACPGRFFASATIKLTILHLIEHYDFQVVDPKAGRPANVIKGAMINPPGGLEILVKRKSL
ncbi:cytochrome P450 [Trichoderma chlorosporum]